MCRTIFQAVMSVVFILSSIDAGHAEMTIAVTSLSDGAYFDPCSDIPLTCEVTTTGEAVKNVRYYANGLQIGYNRNEPWDDVWEEVLSGNYEITARVEDQDGNRVYTEESLSVKIGAISGGDLIRNGGFDCGKMTPWSLQNYEGAVSRYELLSDYYFDDSTYIFIEVENGSSAIWHIQLQQPFPIDSGHTYEAWFWGDADEPRSIEVGIQEGLDPYTTYLWQTIEIDGVNDYGPYVYESMTTDPTSIFKLNCGGVNVNCYFDNVRVLDKSITSVKSIDLSFADGTALEYELYQNYPNPFNAQTELRYRLSTPAFVDLTIYNIQGRLVKNLVNERMNEGTHRIRWDGTDMTNSQVPSGVYFYRIQAQTGERRVDLARKLLMLK